MWTEKWSRVDLMGEKNRRMDGLEEEADEKGKNSRKIK